MKHALQTFRCFPDHLTHRCHRTNHHFKIAVSTTRFPYNHHPPDLNGVIRMTVQNFFL